METSKTQACMPTAATSCKVLCKVCRRLEGVRSLPVPKVLMLAGCPQLLAVPSGGHGTNVTKCWQWRGYAVSTAGDALCAEVLEVVLVGGSESCAMWDMGAGVHALHAVLHDDLHDVLHDVLHDDLHDDA